jgi:peptidoglycan/xylan/chitin deacetylase (PgdA/CDA1 family)
MIGYALAAAAGMATGLGYHSMAPRSQLFGRTFCRAGNAPRRLALTYDDGPNDPHTLRLLEVLDRHGVKATFFMIGRYVAQRPDIAQAVARAGHAIGNHTHTHPNLIFCSRARIRLQLEECERMLTQAVGTHATLFRPPFGGRRPAVLRAAKTMGLTPVMWSAAGCDWKLKSADQIEDRIARRIRGGDVILLHDGSHVRMGVSRAATVEATELLIRRYADQGFGFVTVPEMLEQSPTVGG